MNLFNRHLFRSPDGESGGAAVAEPVAATETPVEGTATTDTAKEASTPEAPTKLTDWQAYQKMQEKFAKRPNARPAKHEVDLMAKYQGKDESEIEGYTPEAGNVPQPKDKKPETKIQPKPAIPKGFESLIGEKSPVGAKTLEDLPAKVESLHKEFQKLNGERGTMGRILQEAGVQSLPELQKEIAGARSLHRLIEDAKAGNPKALEFLGLNKPQAAQQVNGQAPEDVLDEGLFNHFSPIIQDLKQQNEELRRQLQERFGVLDRFKDEQQKTAMTAARQQAVNEITSEFAALAAEAPHLWDPKAGNLHKAISDYYAQDGDFHPGLKVFNEILQIAKDQKIPNGNLELAVAYWERKNRGSIIKQAQDEARRPFIGKPPTVGLSDQQQAHGGQFTEFTRSQLQNLGRPGYPRIPSEWVDAKSGDLIPSKIPAYARAIVLGEEE